MPNDHDSVENHVMAGRTRTDDARAGDPDAPEAGVTPAVPSYTDEGRTSDLGVDEPALPEAEPDPSAPTGMFAGETERSRAREDAVRARLEERHPSTTGDWKTSGGTPSGET